MSEVIRCRGAKICSPFVSRDPLSSSIYYVSAGTGEIFECVSPENSSQQQHVSLAFTGGEPYSAQFDQKGRIHIADCAHAAVLRVDDNGQPGVMVKAYEERAFRGPSAIAFGSSSQNDDRGDDTIYFTDSGPLGETTLEKPRGTIFSICTSPSGGQILRPLALECLAHPCGIAASSFDSKVLFVAEMMQNRIVRLCRRPSNTHHMSVFHQFAGGLGPSCIACGKSGDLFVGHFDFAGGTNLYGKVSVLSADGVLQYTLQVPGTEITGICLSADQSFVIVTETSNNAIHRLPVR